MAKDKNFVPIESLVDAQILQTVDSFSLEHYQHRSKIRGLDVDWLCLSRRLLWMAEGHEYIEPELLDWIDSLPDDAVLYDAGASNGIFALYAAARGCQVYAFEPDPTNYFLISFNNFLNKRAHGFAVAGCMNLALSDSNGLGEMRIGKMELGGHLKFLNKSRDVFGRNFEPEHTHPVIRVSCDALHEQFGIPRPTHLKIDVDGSEVELLKGARSTLRGVESVFIEATEALLDQFLKEFFESEGFTLSSKIQVQNYSGLHNCVFDRAIA